MYQPEQILLYNIRVAWSKQASFLLYLVRTPKQPHTNIALYHKHLQLLKQAQ